MALRGCESLPNHVEVSLRQFGSRHIFSIIILRPNPYTLYQF
jgi:hypothetical protein